MANAKYFVYYVKIFKILYLCGLLTMYPNRTFHIVQFNLYFHYCLFYISTQVIDTYLLLTIVLLAVYIVYNTEREKISHFIMNKTITNKMV